MSEIVVLGSGMAGLGAAHWLRGQGVRATLYEKHHHPGGHTAAWTNDLGFTFDEGPHVSFTKDARIQALFADAVGGEFEAFSTYVNNYWQGHWIKHPAQCNLHGLPTDLVVQIIQEFAQLESVDGEQISNYEEWLLASFGPTFAHTFPAEYTRKFHTTEPANMSTDWLGPRLYKPVLEEVIRGALTPKTDDVHYVADFRYPKQGGFYRFIEPLVRASEVRLGQEVVAIDPAARGLTFRDGTRRTYDGLVSSLPLPDLVRCIGTAPDSVRQAAAKLACTHCVLVNLGVAREGVSEAHWTYFYDRDIIMTRASFPHRFSPGTVPPGTSSIQVEIYYSDKYRPRALVAEEHIEPTIKDLIRCGILEQHDRILCSEAKVIPYANVIFDLERGAALEEINGFLADTGICSAGRYGEWGYHWTDESFKSGERAAERLLTETSTLRRSRFSNSSA